MEDFVENSFLLAEGDTSSIYVPCCLQPTACSGYKGIRLLAHITLHIWPTKILQIRARVFRDTRRTILGLVRTTFHVFGEDTSPVDLELHWCF